MPVLNEARHPGEFILSEANMSRSREAITIAAGTGVLEPGTVVGLLGAALGTASAVKTDVGGGKGALTLANPAVDQATVKAGVYKVIIIEPATNAGNFEVEDPDGVVIGTGVVGVAFDGAVKFTLADGGTDFAAGDTALITVTKANPTNVGKYKKATVGNTDGTQNAAAVIIYGVDATSVDVKVAAIVRDAEINGHNIVFDASVDDAPKTAAMYAGLASKGIIVRN